MLKKIRACRNPDCPNNPPKGYQFCSRDCQADYNRNQSLAKGGCFPGKKFLKTSVLESPLYRLTGDETWEAVKLLAKGMKPTEVAILMNKPPASVYAIIEENPTLVDHVSRASTVKAWRRLQVSVIGGLK